MDLAADEGSIRHNKKNKQSKNVVSERRRRQKMNKLLYTLRALVPNISKVGDPEFDFRKLFKRNVSYMPRLYIFLV